MATTTSASAVKQRVPLDPARVCDVVMKGGITSGVIYPGVLHEIAMTYRIKGIGGASAGAIGAAVGAAAEFGRPTGGYERLAEVPDLLGEGALGRLFQPQDRTKALLPIMLAATGPGAHGKPRPLPAKIAAIVRSAVVSFPAASTIGLIPGVALMVLAGHVWGWAGLGAVVGGIAAAVLLGALAYRIASAVTHRAKLALPAACLPTVALVIVAAAHSGWTRVALLAVGLVAALLGGGAAIVVRLVSSFTSDVPENLFGICRGLGRDANQPGFTDWLCNEIDRIAGSPDGSPLTFGQLWDGPSGATSPTAQVNAPADPTDRVEATDREEATDHDEAMRSAAHRTIDLRMVTTCLSEGRPYEMPWEARRFFFDPVEWKTLFPDRVVAALLAHPAEAPTAPSRAARWAEDDEAAAAHTPPLHRLPDPQHLPVIVATRLSLSFPLLISAVPLWSICHDPADAPTAPTEAAAPPPAITFRRLLFTDGGFCSNFPVYMFDAALPAHPTFAINLGSFEAGQTVSCDQTLNVQWAKDNRPLPQPFTDIPATGFGAIGGFASAAFNTARNWQDNSHINFPGYRDRIVRVLQTASEGGLNLHMEQPTIDGLADRGKTAAAVLVEQFDRRCYRTAAENPMQTGWDNHRWVRYRALLSVLPEWLESYRRGYEALDIDPAAPPSYRLGSNEIAAADRIATELEALAVTASAQAPQVIARLVSAPNPPGALRRVPRI